MSNREGGARMSRSAREGGWERGVREKGGRMREERVGKGGRECSRGRGRMSVCERQREGEQERGGRMREYKRGEGEGI